MTGQRYTRCPGCKTIFRVTPEQLAMRGGNVRCGHCKKIFDGVAGLISLAPERRASSDEEAYDDFALGPPTVTLRDARALGTAHDSPATAHEIFRESRESEQPSTENPPPGGGRSARTTPFTWKEPRVRRSLPPWVFGAAIPLLVLGLAAQAMFHFRDAIAARWPGTKPALVRLCSIARCGIGPVRDIGALSIEASDLQADPAHRGLLVLAATVRNRAPYPLAYPYFELTLTDAQDRIVVRRAFPPQEYASGTADVQTGIAGNAELPIKIFIDASATTQAGYQVYLFYP